MARSALALVLSLFLHGSLVYALGILVAQPLQSADQGLIVIAFTGSAASASSAEEHRAEIRESLPQEPETKPRSQPAEDPEALDQAVKPSILSEPRPQTIQPAQQAQAVAKPQSEFSPADLAGQAGEEGPLQGAGELSNELGSEPGSELGNGNAQAFGGDYELGQTNGPGILNFVQPAYPPEARRQGLEGRVLLRVLVGPDGKAREIQVLEASHNLFIDPARLAALRSSYRPLLVAGQAQAAWVRLPLNFRLQAALR